MIDWLLTLSSDYVVTYHQNFINIKHVKVSTLFEKAYNCFKFGNSQRAINILGIQQIYKNNCNKEECIICIDNCSQLLKTNCGHYVCLNSLFEWLYLKHIKTQIYVCPACSQLLIFQNCKIIV